MTETVAPASGDPASPAGDATEMTGDITPQSQTPRTVEEVEAEWRNRFSNRDRAHNEEAGALRERLATLEKAAKTREQEEQESRLKSTDEATRAAAERDEYKRMLEEERAARVMEARRNKFPLAADALDEATLASMDEAKLAALNVRLGGDSTVAAPPVPSLIDKNSAARTGPASSGETREKTSAELKAELAAMSSDFSSQLRDGR